MACVAHGVLGGWALVGVLGIGLAPAACGGAASSGTPDTTADTSADTTADTGADTVAPVTAPVLQCPQPGPLPFAVGATALDTEGARYLIDNYPRVKDSGADYLGVPGGAGAITTQSVDDALLDGSVQPIVGRMARSPNELGLAGDPVSGEWVSAWQPLDDGGWQQVGRARSGDDGEYAFELAGADRFGVGSHALYGVLEGAGSCVEHDYYLWPAATEVVVTDIDGTLTLDDNEMGYQIADGSYVPQQKTAADQLMRAWHDKGYQIIYITARPHVFRAETRAWLASEGYPPGPIITASELVFDAAAITYKTAWLGWIKGFGWQVVAAYGNANSDIQAYENAAIQKDRTFIIGPEAGASSTVAIANDDFSDHIAGYVAAQPVATPTF